MLKNKILLAIFALVLSTTIKSQTIVIDDARLLGALPVGGSYGSGSTVAIPINVTGCTNFASTYQWNVLGPTGLSVGASGQVNAFYTTFINIVLPSSLATGNYKVEVKSTSVNAINDTSVLFPVTNIATPIIAKATPIFSDLILQDQFYYGICDGNAINGMALKDSSTTGGVDSLELIDNYRVFPAIPNNGKYTPDGSGRFNLVFTPTSTFGKSRDAYYTAYVKTIGAGNIVSTIGYHVINSSWDILSYVEAKSVNYSCSGDTVSLAYVIDRTQSSHLQQNFPGATIRVNWNDGLIETYSQCQIFALNGKIRHRYAASACTNGSTSFKVTSTVNNPFNIFNGPGITGTCAAGAKSEAEAFVFSPPKARFNTDTVICAMDTLKFRNLSDPGQGLASSSGLTVCSQLANYTWVIDGNLASPLYQTPPGKVEPRKDTAYSFNANQVGYHNITLYVNNNYGLQAPCIGHDTTRRICVDTAKVRPDFQLDSAGLGIYRDSLVGCAPVFCIKNNTKRTFCVDSTKFKYHWRVLDATSPGPNYTEVLKTSGDFSYAIGSSDTSRQPCISINKTGKYFIELMASASCALDSSLRMLKYIEANGDAGVNFPLGSDTVYNCSYATGSSITINYSPTAPFNPAIGLVDSVYYTYQASSGGALSYKWRVLSGTYGTNYTFVGGTDSTSAYPQIQFLLPGLYPVQVFFTNNCQPKTAIQYVAYRQPVTANSGGTIDSICHTTNTFNITGASVSGGGTVGQIVWNCTNCDGTFSPSSGTPSTPNIFNPVYTPGPNDKLISCDTGYTFDLRMTSYGIRPSNCSILSSTRRLFIRPCVEVPDAELDGCSGSTVNYSITKSGLVGSVFTWTSTVGGGTVNGNTNSGVGGSTIITDVLTGNGYVIYTLYPIKDGCVGNPFTVTDTVRPQPTAPAVNLIYPSNATQSMCSGDTVNIQMTGNSPNDLFNWTSFNNQGKITGLTSLTNQPGQILDQLFNNTAPLLIDTATYCIRTVSEYGCIGTAQTCQSIIVTPGPNKALVTEPTKLRYLCRLSCDTLKANGPGAAGIGTWTIKSYTGTSVPVIGNVNDSITTVCGLLPGQSYNFQWQIDPVIAGCNGSTDVLNIQVTDTIATPNAGTDTVICDVNGAIQRVVNINGTLSRPLLPTEFVYYNGVLSTTLAYPFYFTNKGLYTIEMRVKNFVCQDKVDTVLVRAFTNPLGGSVTVSPIQTSFCQGSPVTITANFDTSVGDIYRWEYQIARPPFTTFKVGQGQNPYTYTADENSGYNALIISKGWSYGCRDSVYTSGYNVKVDSTTIVGTITGTDTIVCVPNTVVTLKANGQRGSVKGWIRSTINGTTGYSAIFAIGNPVSVSVASTTWYRAIVQNGNCAADTTAPFRIFIPSGADAAKTANDTAVCNATSFLLTGNTPLVGNGSWQMIQGLINIPLAGTFTFGAAPNDTTSQNPVLANIQQYGTYQFVWKIKNLTCDATADTITVVNTAPIANNSIGVAADTVCSGTKVTVTSGLPTGGSGVFAYDWQYSTNAGATWTTGSTATFAYTFTATTDVWVRRVVKSDSCYDYGNTINFIVQPNITNNTLPVLAPVCINSPAPLINGSTPTGGSGTYNYTWNYGTTTDTTNNLWINPNIGTEDYTPAFNLVDTLHFRRIVSSGKCSDTSAVSTITVYPDAKASFTTNKTIGCAPFIINIDVPNPPALNTNFNWYATTGANVRTAIGTGAGFPGYTITTGLDSIMITVVASSTLGCKSDSTSRWFYTSATPFASFTVSKDSGCANNTGLNTTTFNFTNTTPNQNLFTYVFNYGNGTATSNPNPNPIDYAPSTTGLDTLYTVVLTATSPSCGSSQANKLIKIRTRPKVNFSLTPTYQCSGGVINFTNATVGSPNLTYAWIFGDAGNTVGSTNNDTVSHIYNVTSLTTFVPKVIATNECASDSATNSVVIAANTVTLNISVRGTDKYKCLPDTVRFYSNSNGGTSYIWDFGDGNQSIPSTNGVDSIDHIYTTPGKFIVKLTGSTTCGSVFKTDSVFAYGNPIVTYTINPNTTVCIGDTVRFANQFNDSTTYVWDFGNGTGSGANPARTYGSIGSFPVKVTGTRQHTLPLGGPIYCTAVSGIQTVTIRDTMPATFTITPLGASCLPYTVTFNNTTPISTLPISTTNWSFGIPGQTSTANPVNYTYNALGQYNVNLVVTNAGGCIYTGTQQVNVSGPTGTWTHDTGYNICGATPVNFQINASSTDSVTINYGDATPVVTVPFSSLPNPFTHIYTVGGNYNPSVTLKSVNGCTFFIGSFGTVRVDYVKASYTINPQIQTCGTTLVGFTNTSNIDQTPISAVYLWNINGVTYNTANPSVTFNTTGVYNVRMQVTSVSGCFDSVVTTPVYVKVNNVPNVLSITRQDTACAGQTINYTANPSLSEDPITNYNWSFGNGTTGSGMNTQTVYGAAGIYFDTVTVVTSAGCTFTRISTPLVINGSPIVSINPSTDTSICLGASISLAAFSSGTTPIANYDWFPPIGLNTTVGANVIATPTSATKYVVTGTSARGCADTASINVDVVQPYTITVTPAGDSICLGESVVLTANGATSYLWSPAAGLDTIRGARVVATPNASTVYTVVGTNAANCFPNTSATVTIGVGDTTRISLGLDTVHLQGGTTLPLNVAVINGPIATWAWTPSTGLSCNDCGNPIATIGGNICYSVEATSIYGCKASDDICIVAFCEASQVFIPNAFTPDADGVNDYFYVSANGISKVLSLRVFNRWGQVVFERSGFTPVPYKSTSPNTLTSWNGYFKGVIAPTDVYVYTCEVVCANGTKFTYTGNITLIK